MKQNTKKYKSYEHMLQDLGEEEMAKAMKKDINHVFDNFPEIWRLFTTLKEKQRMTDERLHDLELIATPSLSRLKKDIKQQLKEQKNDA